MVAKVFQISKKIKEKRTRNGLVFLSNEQFNFITPNVTDDNIDLFFAPEDKEEFILIEKHWTMAHIMFHAGVFDSVSNARKNGWDKPIQPGFSLFEGVGKRNKQISILTLPTQKPHDPIEGVNKIIKICIASWALMAAALIGLLIFEYCF